VVLVNPATAIGAATATKSVDYAGKAVSLKF
jgi:hypothetical protein